MSFARLLPQTVTILPAGATPTSDAEGNVTTTDSDSFEVSGRLQRTGAIEANGARTTESTGWLLFLPAGTVIGPHDRVQVGADRFDVDGPAEQVMGARAVHHLEVRLRAIA